MEQSIHDILTQLRNGEITVEEAELKLKLQPFADIGYAKVDMHRKLRQGAGEVIYGAGKTPEQIGGIIRTMLANGQSRILITRLDEEKYLSLCENMAAHGFPDTLSEDDAATHGFPNTLSENAAAHGFPDTLSEDAAAHVAPDNAENTIFRYSPAAQIAIVGGIPKPDGAGKILVATGGTSDIPVAEEAALTAEFLGNEVARVFDVGVAGLHRLLPHIGEIMSANVVIAIAGMEGALASVVGGLADCPVIAVPTSIGYGASFGGVSALLSMLNSCASGVSVVNIDNGFGAAFIASRINHPKTHPSS